MPLLAKGIPRALVLALALAAFCLLPPESLAHGPNLCLWRRLFHIAACPACGSTRALAAFFHGQITQAFHWNPNVVITAPTLLFLLAKDLLSLATKHLAAPPSRLSLGLWLSKFINVK